MLQNVTELLFFCFLKSIDLSNLTPEFDGENDCAPTHVTTLIMVPGPLIYLSYFREILP